VGELDTDSRFLGRDRGGDSRSNQEGTKNHAGASYPAEPRRGGHSTTDHTARVYAACRADDDPCRVIGPHRYSHSADQDQPCFTTTIPTIPTIQTIQTIPTIQKEVAQGKWLAIISIRTDQPFHTQPQPHGCAQVALEPRQILLEPGRNVSSLFPSFTASYFAIEYPRLSIISLPTTDRQLALMNFSIEAGILLPLPTTYCIFDGSAFSPPTERRFNASAPYV
jgi:hypothetical protein